MDEIEKKPVIRFKEYDDAWEQRKLGELARFSKGNGYTKSDLIDSGTPIILYGSLYTNYQSSISKVKTYVELKEKSVISKGNEVIVPSSGESSEDISRASVVDTAGIILGGDLNIIKVTDLINPLFLALTISNGTQQKELSKRAQGKSVVHLNNSDLKSVNLIFPKTEEQTKIGNFFKQLDETITLQERELNLLENQRKYFLQKIFIEKYKETSQIKFPRCNSNWTEAKAKKIFSPIIEKGRPELPVLSVTQDNGVVYRDEVGIDIKYDRSTLKNYKVINKGNFVISLRSFQGGFELSDKKGITSPAYTIFNPKEPELHDNNFWKIYFKTFRFIESLKTVTFGIRDGKSISFSEFGDLKIYYPCLSEQQKLGELFNRLDENIALHEKKLNTLKNMKKALLQKMFV